MGLVDHDLLYMLLKPCRSLNIMLIYVECCVKCVFFGKTGFHRPLATEQLLQLLACTSPTGSLCYNICLSTMANLKKSDFGSFSYMNELL